MLSLSKVPLANLKQYPVRTFALLLFAAVMAFALFFGTMAISGVSQGLETVESRLGADILVVPDTASGTFDAQSVLLQAEPGYFYMDAGKVEEIRQVEGIEQLSQQLFLASSKSGCCSARLQLIAFDPDSDFTIQPWIHGQLSGQDLGFMELIVGSNVTVYDDRILKIYDLKCTIVGQFDPTGSTMDNAVYMNFDTVKALIQASFEKGLNRYQTFNADDVVSAVLIKVKPGYDIESVAAAIQRAVPGIQVSTARNMLTNISDSLNVLSRTLTPLLRGFWLFCTLMIIFLFLLMIYERRREFASLRMMGASRSILSGILSREAVAVTLCGGLIGLALAALLLTLFKPVIEQALGIGYVLPSPAVLLFRSASTLCALLLAAALSAAAASILVNRTDASIVMKELA